VQPYHSQPSSKQASQPASSTVPPLLLNGKPRSRPSVKAALQIHYLVKLGLKQRRRRS